MREVRETDRRVSEEVIGSLFDPKNVNLTSGFQRSQTYQIVYLT